MSNNNIPKVTQDEFEPEIETNPRLAMANPNLVPPKKKLQQMGIFGKQAIKGVVVPAHMRGNKLVDAYEKMGQSKAKGKKKQNKAMKPKKKKATQPKHTDIPTEEKDCKESLEMVSFLVWQDKIEMMKDSKKK
jgi:hypothetical protein